MDKPISYATQFSKDEAGLIILYDNTSRLKILTPSWGFACLVTDAQKTILFDTGGDGSILLNNARKMNVNLKEVDAIVISHIHGDHTGGLDAALRQCGHVRVFLPGDTSYSFLEHVRAHQGAPVLAEQPTAISAGMMTTGTLVSSGIGEQGLCVETHSGGVLITGCAHPGVVEMVAIAGGIVPHPIHCVIGGFHMGWHSSQDIDAAVSALKGLGVTCVGPCHCTGRTAKTIFADRFGQNCLSAGAGFILHFAN